MQTSAPISVIGWVELSSELRKRLLESSSTAALPWRSTLAVPRSSRPSRRNLASASADSSRGNSMAWQRCRPHSGSARNWLHEDALVDLDSPACRPASAAHSASTCGPGRREARHQRRPRRRPAARCARTWCDCRSACRRACGHGGAGRRSGRRARPPCPACCANRPRTPQRPLRSRRSRPAPQRSCPWFPA